MQRIKPIRVFVSLSTVFPRDADAAFVLMAFPGTKPGIWWKWCLCEHKHKWSKREHHHARLRMQPYSLPMPSLLPANVHSLNE